MSQSHKVGYWVDLTTIELSDSASGTKGSWIQAMPLGRYKHPFFGEIDITPDKVANLARSVENNVRETELDIDYDHKRDSGEAAGWVKKAEARDNEGLFLFVEWTKQAAEKIKNKIYRYFSAEFADEWEHPKTGAVYKDVLFGGGITNRPFLKDIMPLNLSDLDFDTKDLSDDVQTGTKTGTANPPGPPAPRHQGGGNQMTAPKKFNELSLDTVKALGGALGLGEDVSAETVQNTLKALAEAGQLPGSEGSKESDKDGDKETRLADGELDATLLDDVAKLTADNPALKVLGEVIANQQRELNTTGHALRFAEAQGKITKLNEKALQKKRAFPSVIEEDLRDILIDAPKHFSEKVYSILEKLASVGMVQLGEIGYGNRTQVGMDLHTRVLRYMESHRGMSYGDAMVEITRDNPSLADQHRSDSYIEH